MPRCEAVDVRDEEVVADELHACSPSSSVSAFQPSQSSSAQPSSMRDDRVLLRRALVDGDELVARDAASCRTCTCRSSCRRTRSPRSRARARRLCPACSRPPRSRRTRYWMALPRSSARRGAKPPSSPTAVVSPLSFSSSTSASGKPRRPRGALPRRSARPRGTIMNSWISRPLSACTPPFRMFMSGVGRTRACTPPR